MTDNATLEIYAEVAAQNAISQYGIYARNLNLSKEEFISLIRKIAEHAVKIVSGKPA